MKEQREKRIRKTTTTTTTKSHSIIFNGKKEFGKRSFIYDDCKKSYYYIFYYIYNTYILYIFYIYFIYITYFKTHVPEFVSEGLQLC